MSCLLKRACGAFMLVAVTLAGCTTTLRTDVVGFEEEKKPERSVGSYLFGEEKPKSN